MCYKKYKRYISTRVRKLNIYRMKEERALRAHGIDKRRRKQEKLSFTKQKIKERKEEDAM